MARAKCSLQPLFIALTIMNARKGKQTFLKTKFESLLSLLRKAMFNMVECFQISVVIYSIFLETRRCKRPFQSLFTKPPSLTLATQTTDPNL